MPLSTLTPDAVAIEEFGDDNPRRLPRIRHDLTLPFPPSMNRLWRYVGKGKVTRSPEYDLWLKTCDGCVLEQLGIPAYRSAIAGRYRLDLTLDHRRFGQIDQDNCVKAVSDALQRNRLIANDKHAWQTTITWGDTTCPQMHGPNCRVRVEAC